MPTARERENDRHDMLVRITDIIETQNNTIEELFKLVLKNGEKLEKLRKQFQSRSKS